MRGISVIKTTPNWVWVWIAFFLILGAVPFAVTWLTTPDDMTYTGTLYNALDLNSYLANMQQGQQGRWLYILPFTAQRSTPIPLFMLYILLGHVARITSLSLPLVFHVARIVCGAVFALTAYHFIAHFLQREAERKLAFGLLLFTSGLSWLVIAIMGSNLSDDLLEIPDYWMSDVVSFLAMLSNPHFTLNMTLMMWLILVGEAFFQRGEWRAALPALLAALGIALVHAHQLAVVGLVVGLGWLWRCWHDRRIRWAGALRIAVVFGPAALLAGTLTVLSWQDDLLASWLRQGVTLSPPPWATVFILYGPAFWLAVTGVVHIMRQQTRDLYPIAWWFGVVLVLMYLPVNFQRRFLEGFHVPAVMLAAVGWRRVMRPWLVTRASLRTARAVGALWIVSLALTPLVNVTQGLLPALNPDGASVYMEQDTYDALMWLRAQVPDDAAFDTIVFASLDSGNLIPAWVPVRTTLGHWSLTAYAADRLDDADLFFDTQASDAARIAMLRELDVDYVYVGAAERELGAFDPAGAAYLEPAFTSATVSIYRFDDAAPGPTP